MVAHKRSRQPLKCSSGGGFVPRPLDRRHEQLRANCHWCVSTSRAHDNHLQQDEQRVANGACRAARGAKVHHKARRRQPHTHTQQVSGGRAAAAVLKAVPPKKSPRHTPQGVEGEVKGRVEARGDSPIGQDQRSNLFSHIGRRGHKGAVPARVASQHGSRAKVRVGSRTTPM